METILSAALIAVIVSVVGGILKQSISNLSKSLKDNTLAVHTLTTDYRVHDSELKALGARLYEHGEVHKKFDNTLDELQRDLNEVKGNVKVLLDRGGNNNNYTNHNRK